MSKKRTLTLAITKPCKVGWDKMTQTEQGKHCAQCNKTVTDFTNYTDKELVDFFKNAKGNVCGRFETYQMNRALPLSEPNSNSFLYKAIFGSAIAASIVTAVNGQDINQASTHISAGAAEYHASIKIQKKHPVPLRYIKGKIIDSKTQASVGSGVTITIKGTSISATTDMDGTFALPVTDSLANKRITLIAESYYYKKKKTTVNAGNYMDFITIALKVLSRKSTQLMGNVRYL